MSSVIEHYASTFHSVAAQLPGADIAWLQTLRRGALDIFTDVGFPTTRDEDWKYTLVNAIEKREGVGAAAFSHQQRVTLGVVACTRRPAMRRNEPAIGVVRVARRDPLGDDAADGVLAQMDHLGARIYLLIPVRYGNRIKLTL